MGLERSALRRKCRNTESRFKQCYTMNSRGCPIRRVGRSASAPEEKLKRSIAVITQRRPHPSGRGTYVFSPSGWRRWQQNSPRLGVGHLSIIGQASLIIAARDDFRLATTAMLLRRDGEDGSAASGDRPRPRYGCLQFRMQRRSAVIAAPEPLSDRLTVTLLGS